MAGIKKTDFSAIKKKFSKEAEYKPDRFFDLGDAFLDACGIPGPAMGHINMLLGHSDTGKTTALVKSAVDAQKKGIVPVFIITEQKWSWDHAELMGFNKDGDYLFNSDFEYIEQITDYINELLDAQEKGDLPHDLLILWDSVGSVPCKMTYDGKGGKQHNASVLADKIGMGLNQRISGSRRTDKPYTNTLIIVNQPWVELPDNPFGQPKIKAKGGEAIWLNSSIVFLFGNQKGAGTTKISITKDKRKVKIATRTKISIMKNHINGLGYEDGRILVTSHGFMPGREDGEEKKSIEEYKKESGDYISKMLGVSVTDITDVEVVTEDSDL
jgi:RecA/RadA recombinase